MLAIKRSLTCFQCKWWGTNSQTVNLSFVLCGSMAIINLRVVKWETASRWLSLSDQTNQINVVLSGEGAKHGHRQNEKLNTDREAGKFDADMRIMRCGTPKECHWDSAGESWGDWSDGSGVVSSVSPGVGVRVGDLIDWLPDWGDPAESEWSVYQTVLGQEDSTLGMMGNEWLWGGRRRADGDWQMARFVLFI